MSGREHSRDHDRHRVGSRPHDCDPARYVEWELAASRQFDSCVIILSHSLWKVRATYTNLLALLCRTVSVFWCVQSSFFNTEALQLLLHKLPPR